VRVDDLTSPLDPPPQPAIQKRHRSDATDIVSKPSVATITPAKRLRPAAKPASAVASNLYAESPLHLLPRFVHIISQIEDEKL
jgi:hypothetical protein